MLASSAGHVASSVYLPGKAADAEEARAHARVPSEQPQIVLIKLLLTDVCVRTCACLCSSVFVRPRRVCARLL